MKIDQQTSPSSTRSRKFLIWLLFLLIFLLLTWLTIKFLPKSIQLFISIKNQGLCSINGYSTQRFNDLIQLDDKSNFKLAENIIDQGSSALNSIQKLTCLESLTILGSYQVTNIVPLSKLTNLKNLSINSTGIKNLTPLSNLTNLNNLTITNAPVNDISALASLKQLKYLNLSGTLVIDLSPISQLNNLTGLSLMNTQVIDLTPLNNLSNLQTLTLAQTRWSNMVLRNINPFTDPLWQTKVIYPEEITTLLQINPKLTIDWLGFGIQWVPGLK